MTSDDDRNRDDQQRREFLKKLSLITSGVVASTYVSPSIAMATSTAGVSPGGMIPMVVVQSLFNFMQTQGSPDAVVLWCVQQGHMSQETAVFTYDQLRGGSSPGTPPTVERLNMFVNGYGPMPGVASGDQGHLNEARAALRAAAVKATTKSKWPWE
jgi:hypothetical protein